MIVCRNVVIYLTEEAKAHIYQGLGGRAPAQRAALYRCDRDDRRSGDIGFRTAGASMSQPGA